METLMEKQRQDTSPDLDEKGLDSNGKLSARILEIIKGFSGSLVQCLNDKSTFIQRTQSLQEQSYALDKQIKGLNIAKRNKFIEGENKRHMETIA